MRRAILGEVVDLVGGVLPGKKPVERLRARHASVLRVHEAALSDPYACLLVLLRQRQQHGMGVVDSEYFQEVRERQIMRVPESKHTGKNYFPFLDGRNV